MTQPDPSAATLPAPAPSEPLLRLSCLAVAGLATGPAIALMEKIWATSDFMGHGYFIPLVAGFLLYDRWDDLTEVWTRAETPWQGPFLVVGVAAVLLLAVVGEVLFAAGVAVPLLIGATIYAVAGRELLWRTALPLGFLLLMVPPPGFLVNQVLQVLKAAVTTISVRLLQETGASVTALGNQILIPGQTLFVADACSGLTSVLTLLPLSIIIGYFLTHGVWRRLVVVLAVIPLAMLANILRVVITVLLVDSQGIEFAQGLLHEGFGLSTYVLGTLSLLGVARLIK